MFIYDLSIFLTSTAFVATNAKYGVPLSRYTVFLKLSFRVTLYRCSGFSYNDIYLKQVFNAK